MTARVLPFRRRQTGRVVAGRHVSGLAIALEARPGAVILTAHDIRLGFTPSVARELSRALAELADYADGTVCDHKFVDSKRCIKCGWQP